MKKNYPIVQDSIKGKKLSMIFSFRNEEDVLEELISRVRLVLVEEKNKNVIDDFELIFINDSSSDKSEELLKDMDTEATVIVDPPRAGLNAKVTRRFREIGPKRIIYVSCNPTTQARDVREFINSNYIMGKVQPIDMFPHTHHIECVITLDKKND